MICTTYFLTFFSELIPPTGNIKFDKAVSAAFTGHRFYNFSQKEVIKGRLTQVMLGAYEHGIRNFISGFAIGIDLMAAQIVQSLKLSCPGMTLTAAIPFRGQADRFNVNDKMIYEELMASADEVIILSERYYTRCFLDRDEFMVENASLLIAFYDGREKGGTYYTIKKARHSGIPVVNVY
jgi:uncharacterized phage-like protein YoqJ